MSVTDSSPFPFTISAGVMACPLCGGESTHIDAVAVSARKEDGEFNEIRVDALTGAVSTHREARGPVLVDTDRSDTVGRRQRIGLLGWCEEGGHEFNLVFLQHKGATLVGASAEQNDTDPRAV